MKSALFVQANVAVNTKLTSKVPFLFGNFQVFKKNLVKNVQFRYGTTGKCFFYPPPLRQNFRGKFFRCPFQYPKVPLEAGAPPQSFDASYAPALLLCTCSVPSCNSRSIPFYPNHVHKCPTIFLKLITITEVLSVQNMFWGYQNILYSTYISFPS